MNNREENKNIRKIFKSVMGEMGVDNSKMWNIFYFNDKRKSGDMRVFKSYGWKGWKEVWEKVLIRMNKEGIEGWKLYEGSSFRGDGSVWGIFKKEV